VRHIVPIIEQMSRAAEELSSDHPVHHRLGYILVDNAAELIIHKFAKNEADTRQMWMVDPPLTLRQLRSARKGKFDDKLSFLVTIGKLTPDERRFAAICHEYRNQVYHAGLKHEDIIQAIGGAYYRWCCDAFARFPPRFYGIVSNEKPTPRAHELIERIKVEQNERFVPKVEVVSPYLRAMCPPTPDLAATLTALADEAIDDVKKSVAFIQEDGPRKISVAEILVESQRSRDFEELLERDGLNGDILWKDTDRLDRRNALWEKFVGEFTPRFKQIPFASWRKRAANIAQQSNEVLMLNRYQDLRDAMAYLESAISEMAFQLEMWIQHQIDIARGK
jgi:hypothetical protein